MHPHSDDQIDTLWLILWQPLEEISKLACLLSLASVFNIFTATSFSLLADGFNFP